MNGLPKYFSISWRRATWIVPISLFLLRRHELASLSSGPMKSLLGMELGLTLDPWVRTSYIYCKSPFALLDVGNTILKKCLCCAPSFFNNHTKRKPVFKLSVINYWSALKPNDSFSFRKKKWGTIELWVRYSKSACWSRDYDREISEPSPPKKIDECGITVAERQFFDRGLASADYFYRVPITANAK